MQSDHNDSNNVKPSITVVVPALNEASWIGGCLHSLINQSYPREKYEVVVVDNGSDDGTDRIAEASGARLIRESKKSAYCARNLAIESTRSDWLAFTDADCLANPDWLENLLNCAIENDALIIGGLTLYNLVSPTYGNYLYKEGHSPSILKRAISAHNCVAGNNMFVRRSAFERFGKFEEVKSGADIEFSKRLAEKGFASSYAADAIVVHQCDLSSKAYLKRTFRIKFGQEMQFSRSGFRQMLGLLLHIPWRPGFNAVRPIISDDLRDYSYVSLWLYRWIDRWSGFLGAQMALAKKTFKLAKK